MLCNRNKPSYGDSVYAWLTSGKLIIANIVNSLNYTPYFM